MIQRLMLTAILWLLRGVRKVLQTEPRFFALLGRPGLQPFLAWVGRLKAYQVYQQARRTCPAYARFLEEQHAPLITHAGQLSRLPQTNKENYVRKYDIESRCYGGEIPKRGVVIDESSGSSGLPNSWVRGPAERGSVKAIMQISYSLMFGDREFFILNCFALGPWATGMNVSMSLVDVAILKSVGPDKFKLENALRQFGTRYRYLIAGYPPFIKNFVDTTTLDLAPYDLHLVVGGEGMSEGLRAYFGKWFKSVFSSYGASDLEINVGAETPFTIALRQACWRDADLSKAIFGREDPPMIFQYNPLDYVIESDANGELIFTIARQANVAPKIRYNLHDRGGVYTLADLAHKLASHNIDVAAMAQRRQAFPVVYVYGRTDLSVPFYGCKIFTTDLDHILHGDPWLARHIYSFQISVREDQNHDRRLHLAIEQSEADSEILPADKLHDLFFDGLLHVNQDFREISKMITPQHLIVTVHAYATGPFAGRDIRLKSRYVGPVETQPAT